jgi:hypothetical protein
VPEPESWALMVLGLGVVGCIGLRRKHQSIQPRTDSTFPRLVGQTLVLDRFGEPKNSSR